MTNYSKTDYTGCLPISLFALAILFLTILIASTRINELEGGVIIGKHMEFDGQVYPGSITVPGGVDYFYTVARSRDTITFEVCNCEYYDWSIGQRVPLRDYYTLFDGHNTQVAWLLVQLHSEGAQR